MQRTNSLFRQQWLSWLLLVGTLLSTPLFAASVTITWQPNAETDLAGYKVYYGTASSDYSVSIDVGNVTEYEITDLTAGITYYFAVTAYDEYGNESDYSEEASYSIEDTEPPTIVSVSCEQVDRVKVIFNESVGESSAEVISNYQIDNGIVVQSAELQPDLKTVYLYTTQHSTGSYILTVNNVRDRATVPNAIAGNTQVTYSWGGSDVTLPSVLQAELYSNNFLAVTFSEPLDQTSVLDTSNYSIFPSVKIINSGIDGSMEIIYLTTDTHTPGQTYTLTINDVKDGASPPNTIASNTQIDYTCYAEDSSPPVLIAARLQSATELELEFSESLDSATVETVSNYTITPSITVLGAALSLDRMFVTLTTSEHGEGNYTVTVEGVGDDANPPNLITSAQKEYTYTPPDETPPVLVAAELTSDDLLQLTFSEPLDQTSAESINNYVIDPPVSVFNAIFNVSQIFLETAPHSGGNYRITVNGVKDRAESPNTIATDSYAEYTYEPPDVMPPQLLMAELHGADMVELLFSETLDRTSSENVSYYQIDPYIEIQDASLVGDSLNRVYLETNEHEPGQSYTLTVQGIMDRAPVPNTIADGTQIVYDYPYVDTIPPRLTSVELQADRFLEVVFNEPLDQTSAEERTNYTISPSLAVEEATLDASLKKVFLKTETHQPGTDYTLTVQGVKDRADPPNVIASDNQGSYSCVSQDVIPPHLIRAETHGNQTVELCFSEPLEAASALAKENYTIDNGISVSRVSLSQYQMEVFLETTAHQRGTYTVTVNGVKDLATIPNTILSDSWVAYTYTPLDTIPPVLLSATLINPTMVELTFSEPLNRASAEDSTHYSISNGVTVEKVILDVTMAKVFLETSTHDPGDYTITLNGIKDGSGGNNPISPNTIGHYSYIVDDDIPPFIVSAVLKNEKRLMVTFSESLDPLSAENTANYVINNNIQVQDAFFASSNAQVILETSGHAAGEYVLTVDGIKDASPAKNAIAPYSQIQYTWSPVDTVGPALISAALHTNSYLELTFSEPIDGVESQKVENYTIDPHVEIQNAMLDASLKKVGLLTAAHDPGTYTVRVVDVSDRAFNPNPMGSQNSVEYSYTPPDTVPPNLVSVQLRTPMSLELVFDESLSRASTENVFNYTVEPDIEVSKAYLDASLTTVHLETSPHQPMINYSVRIQGIQDRAPIPNEVVDPIVAEYTYTPPDTSSPVLLSVKLHGASLLELVFNESLEQTSAESRENYRIDPYVEVLNASLDTTSLVKVFLETTAHMPGVGYGINVQNVKDRAPIPNQISSDTWFSYSMPGSGESADDTPPEIARVDVISSTQVDIVFTEPVEKTTAENKDNYSIDEGVIVQSASRDSELVRVHLTTSSHQLGKPYTIHVSNILDQASQPNVLSSHGPVKYLLAEGATLSCLNQSPYEWDVFQSGDHGYVDRDYTIDQVPECLEGAVRVVTANDDKSSTGNGFVSFELRGEATIFVAYDKRISTIPVWLSKWKVTGDQIVDSRSNVFNVYSKDSKSGRVSLGGNEGTMDDNMYLVFIVPYLANGTLLTNLNKTSYEPAHVTTGDVYYIDRDYTIATIPEDLKGLLWIKTANDDKTNRDEDFLCFTLNRASFVYVGYDAQIASLPKWLVDWETFDGQVVDSRGSRFDVLTKEFPAGEVVLGGNCGSVDDNMYLVLIKPMKDGGDDPGSTVPGYFTLIQNYPNPFNPTTTIPFSVHKEGYISLTIYNILGQRVRVLVDENLLEGDYIKEWDGKDGKGNFVASGVYFYRIQQDHFAKTRRMVLMR